MSFDLPDRGSVPASGVSDAPEVDPPAPLAPRADSTTPATPLRRLAADQLVRVAEDVVGIELAGPFSFPEEPADRGLYQHGVHDVSAALVDAQARLAEQAATAWRDAVRGPSSTTYVVAAVSNPAGCLLEDVGVDPTPYVLAYEPYHLVEVPIHVPSTGRWLLTVDSVHRGSATGHDGLRLRATLDGADLAPREVPGDLQPVVVGWAIDVAAGPHRVRFWVERTAPPVVDNFAVPCVTREALGVATVRLTGPRGPTGLGLGCDPADSTCVPEIARAVVERAWRRPASEAALDALEALHADLVLGGADPDAAAAGLVEAVLLSPRFVLQVEPAPADRAVALDPWALASRLSVTLWGAAPDAALRACAAAGDLVPHGAGPCSLRTQAARLLDDPRAAAFRERLAHRWLGLGALAARPAVSAEDRALLRAETEAFLGELLAGEARLEALLTQTTGVRNDALSAYYREPEPGDDTLVPAPLPSPRVGLLGQGAVLVASAKAARTSPTARGAWVSERLLCDRTELPPVPFDPVESPDALAAHADDPVCASCHAGIDALGLPLEAFDHHGRVRALPPAPVTAPDGVVLDGPEALAAWVAGQPGFRDCVVRAVASELTGWPVDADDAARVASWAAASARGGDTWRSLVLAVLTSPSFTHRRAGAP